MSTYQLLTFLGASILLTLAPGPDILFVITQGMSNGRKAAVITACGLCSGIIVHTTAAALGVSAIFHTSALAFRALKYAGAAYLIYLAYKTIREKGVFTAAETSGPVQGKALFRRGIIMNVLNPKVSLFFLAFLPQFVSPETRSVPLQMILLGLIFMVQGVIIFSIIGMLSGTFGKYILQNQKVSKIMGWTAACIYTLIGIRLALSEQ